MRKTLPGRISRRVRHTVAVFLTLLCAVGVYPPLQAAQLGLVVGIDRYRHGSDLGGSLRNLKGAVNDAQLLSSTLRKMGVDLPDARVLINEQATLAAFLDAWEQLQRAARPGDRLIVTFAGHGGQEIESRQPEDEADGLDETLMFWDFDPARPEIGRLLDDELFAMFKAAGDHQIVFVSDSCHSAGMTRSSAGRSRNGGRWEISASLDSIEDAPPAEPERWDQLSHVAYLTATRDESRTVDEILYNNQPHGALSVGFARGIAGEADTDADGIVLRHELQEFVSYQVSTLSSRRQDPGFQPRGSDASQTALFQLQQSLELSALAAPAASQQLLVYVQDGALPAGIQNVVHSPDASLRFELERGNVRVYEGHDRITTFPEYIGTRVNRTAWQAVVDKFRFLDVVDRSFDVASKPVGFELLCGREYCDDAHAIGDKLIFTIDRPAIGGGEFLVLFNLAGNGMLQFGYPLPGDNPRVSSLPYSLVLYVGEPVGRDDIVAGFCRTEPQKLTSLLKSLDGATAPRGDAFQRYSQEYQCQWGRYPLFAQ